MADEPEFRLTFRREAAGAPAGAPAGALAGTAADGTAAVYRVEASGAAGSRRAGTFTLPFTPVELENYILRFSRTRRTVRRIDSPEMTAARKFGGALFEALMTGDVGDGYRVALGIASGSRQNLRISISVTEAPELAAIPWEFLYDEKAFLAITKRTPIVRFLDVEGPARPLEMTLPLRILAVDSQPKGVPALATGTERAQLTAALASVTEAGAVQCDWLEEATLGALNQRLRGGDYHILHFIGHGTFDEAHKEGALAFEDEHGNLDIVGGDRLATIVGPRESLRLVVLNSCEGARSDVGDPFSGVAGRLIEQDVPAVIGMQFEITDRAAILFAREFYTVLAEGKPVDTAVSEARLAILADQNDVEWATPALFMRGSDAHLFSITDAVPIVRVDPLLPDKQPGPAPTDGDTALADDDAGAGTQKPATLAQRIRAWFGARPLMAPLLLASVGILAVAVVAAVVLAQISGPSLHAESSADQPDQMLVTGSGFKEGETVYLVLDGGKLTSTPTVHPGGQLVETFDRPASIPIGREVEITALRAGSGDRVSTKAAFGGVALTPTASSPGTPTVTATPTATAPPSSPAGFTCRPPGTDNQSILFYSNRDANDKAINGGSRLFCIDPTRPTAETKPAIGTIPIGNLIDRTDPITASTWAPAGGEIAFTHSIARGNRDIHILTTDGRLEPLAVDPPGRSTDDHFPAWSAADDFVFVRGLGGNLGPDTTSQLMLTRRDWDTPVPILTGTLLKAPTWSPDGTVLTFFGRHDGGDDFDIGMIRFSSAPVDPAEIETAAAKVTWFGDPEKDELNPSWSPDGRRLVFVRDAGNKDTSADNDIWTADPDLTDDVQLTGKTGLTAPVAQDGNPGWSPRGSQIVFYRGQSGSYHLWLMAKDGQEPVDLMEKRRGESLDPSWR